ncbi:MAG TPA: response regulator [Polyangiales bacterium]|nr:response regulator [Polyangiales bacterium]
MAEDRVTIVIVDDDAGHAELVRRNLRRAGLSNPMLTIESGNEALDYVFRRGAHSEREARGSAIVFLDINISGSIDGIEVLRQIKNDPLTRRLPVIMLTTADDPREIDRCYELGCNVYVTKPVDPGAFSTAIKRLGQILTVASLPSLGGLG